ncbi:hypothetical protein MTR67_023865 [Solanum verrucosum]|uniref:Uncharacterized protein n=1 Tax=Solanum verrucosum TaxID=315347 RepID=A0AAF0R0M4_SOLVR|nr:hypothetical protein MTR67_023865 [Solanum verrucosum]
MLMFFELILAYFGYVFKSACLGKIPFESRGFIVEKQPRKFVKKFGKRHGDPRHSECPTSVSEVWAMGIRATQSTPTQTLKFGLWRPAPLRAPGTPEHQRPDGMAQNIEIPEWKWEMINMDFITGLSRSHRWLRMRFFMGEDADLLLDGSRSRDLEFEVDDWVYLKVSPIKGVMRFGKKGKLSPRYIGPYKISKRIGNVAYELELPQKLAAVHPVFHISMLKKCMVDPSLIIPTEVIDINDSLSYEEIPIQIVDRQVRKLRTKEVALVKVLWRNQFVEEATWEVEEDMKKRYPHLFEFGEIPN